jgi:hypothetical protein
MNEPLDPDIEDMKLTDVEKNGMQFYRNFSNAIEARRIADIVSTLDSNVPPIADLEKLLPIIVNEQPLSLTVVACAFADDQLKDFFKREIPSTVPGGRNELLNGFGPLSRLSQRIQIAYAFGWLSPDLLIELDLLRRIRNDISHKWDLEILNSKLSELIDQRQHPVEEYLADGVKLPKDFYLALQPIEKFRVRLIWLLGRLLYECHTFVTVLKVRLDPGVVLYSSKPPQLLVNISTVCLKHTRIVITGQRS